MTSDPGRTAPRLRVLALPVPVLAVLSLLVAPAAWAHSSLVSSSPAADSVLAAPPTRVELVFNEQIRDFQPKIAITAGAADPVEVTPVVDGATVSADLTGIPWPADAGSGSVAWKIGYRVVSADGHPVSGLVPFSVGDGPAPAGAPTATGGDEAVATPAGPAGAVASSADPALSGWWWAAGAAAAAVAVVVVLAVLRRRRPGSVPGGAPAGGAGGQ